MSPRFCTRLPPPSRSGPKAPGGGGGGGGSRSQSALHIHVLVYICSNVRQFHKIIGMIPGGGEHWRGGSGVGNWGGGREGRLGGGSRWGNLGWWWGGGGGTGSSYLPLPSL